MRDNTILVVPYSTIGNAMTPIAKVPELQGRLRPLTFRVWGSCYGLGNGPCQPAVESIVLAVAEILNSVALTSAGPVR
jgi:hypothetical protein